MTNSTNISSFLILLAVLSANFHPSRCSPQVVDCQREPHDSYNEENRQELAEEIDDVNDYMKMIADQLTNDGVVVVRALSTKFTTSDMDDDLQKIDSLALEAENCDDPKDIDSLEIITSTPKTDPRSILEDESTASRGFETEKSSAGVENYRQSSRD